MDADASPLPREETTPPVTKIYFVLAFANETPSFSSTLATRGQKPFNQFESPFDKDRTLSAADFIESLPMVLQSVSIATDDIGNGIGGMGSEGDRGGVVRENQDPVTLELLHPP